MAAPPPAPARDPAANVRLDGLLERRQHGLDLAVLVGLGYQHIVGLDVPVNWGDY